MKEFKVDIGKILNREVPFFGRKYWQKLAVLTLLLVRTGDLRIQATSVRLILRWPFGLKLHADIVKYGEGSYLSKHADIPKEWPGFEYRLAIILKKPVRGGDLLCENFVINTSRVKVFSTKEQHEVTKIKQGSRTVLLFGLCYSTNLLVAI
jgi:hypothetical protein